MSQRLNLLLVVCLVLGAGAWRHTRDRTAAGPVPDAPPALVSDRSAAVKALRQRVARTDASIARLRGIIAAWRDDTHPAGDPQRWREAAEDAVPAGEAAEVVRHLKADDLVSPPGVALVERWLHEDPLASSRWLASEPALFSVEATASGTALAATPEALAEFTRTDLASAWKDRVLVEAGRALADTLPRQALAAAEGIADPALKIDLQQTILHAWLSADPTQAAAWLGTVSDPAARIRLSVAAARSIGLSDPDLAAQFVAGSSLQGPTLDETAAWIAGRWGQSDPERASAWLARYPGAMKLAASMTPLSEP